ncbi:Putative nuclease HARBI1 [Trachymyrmex cornetzi]|uniref:Putative nuclease HARBI1 n=1 Tax=Trachymyrmex cornetzi TaxID=471704 RepID=A0A151IR63_9HYME|nr:Putative nuclease HARBI1 [Trachymyrmex cornetzi]
MELEDVLGPRLQRQRPYGFSVEHQILTALRFYAVGCYQGSIAEQWDIVSSQPSVSRCVRVVTNAINDLLLRQWVKFPMTNEERYIAQEKFRTAPQPFNGTIGAIDCTHINIIAPKEHEEAYVNHWGDHSINVQAICDPDLKILNVNARYPGARHDAYIWSNSPIRRIMERRFRNGERNTWLIGDDGYGLEPWLMTPLKNEIPGSPRFRYNDALCSARSCVERLFGVWKAVFRCLSAQRQLMYEPGMSGKIVNACAVLHNMRIAHRINDIEFDDDFIQDVNRENIVIGEDERQYVFQGRATAIRIQENFIARQYGRD